MIKKQQKNRRKPTDFVEAGDDVAQVDPGRPSFCYLVEQVIPEKLQQVAIARLWPRRVFLKPETDNTRSQSRNTNTKAGRVWYKCYLLWPLVDGAQFGQQAEETAILHLLQIKELIFTILFQ